MFESIFTNSRCNVFDLIFFNASKCAPINELSKSKNVSSSILTICSTEFSVLIFWSSMLSNLESSSIMLPSSTMLLSFSIFIELFSVPSSLSLFYVSKTSWSKLLFLCNSIIWTSLAFVENVNKVNVTNINLK